MKETYYERNKERILQRQKLYIQNNKEKVLKQKKEWARKHRTELREKGLLPPTKKNLQQKIDKAIEYIKNYLPNYDFDHSNLEKLLEILGDKE